MFDKSKPIESEEAQHGQMSRRQALASLGGILAAASLAPVVFQERAVADSGLQAGGSELLSNSNGGVDPETANDDWQLASDETKQEVLDKISGLQQSISNISTENIQLQNELNDIDSQIAALVELLNEPKVHIGETPPSDTKKLWINTAKSGVVTYYVNSSWKECVSVWG